jgi:hypothetical protein
LLGTQEFNTFLPIIPNRQKKKKEKEEKKKKKKKKNFWRGWHLCRTKWK